MDVKTRIFPRGYIADFVRFACLAFALVGGTGVGAVRGAAQDVEYTVDGSRTFDGRPFVYRIERSQQLADSVRFTLSFPSPMDTNDAKNDRITALYDLPPGLADALSRGDTYVKRPVVLIMHILDGNDALAEMMAQSLVKRGVATIRFKLPYYGERGGERGPEILLEDPELLAKSLEQAMVDLRRVVDLAATRPEVNSDCIGISGVSLGAIVSATAVGVEPRLNRAMLILGGGDLETILGYSVETAELRRGIDSLPEPRRKSIWELLHRYDPLGAADRLRSLAQQGRIRLITAEEDEVIPPICAQKLAKAMDLPADQWQTLPQQGHYTAMRSLPMMLDQLGDFFAADLPDTLRTARPEVTDATPRKTLFTMLRQVSLFMTTLPMDGRCYRVELAANATIPGERDGESGVFEGRFGLKLGAARRFRLEVSLPQIPNASFYCGQNTESLWLYSVEHKALFTAKLPFDETGTTRPVDPLQTVDPDAWRRLQMVVGLAAGAGFAPNLLNQWVTFQEVTTERVSLLRMNAREWPVEAILTLRPGTDTPEKLRVVASEFPSVGSDGFVSENGVGERTTQDAQTYENGETTRRQTVVQVIFDAWDPDAVEITGQYDPPDATQCETVQTVTVDDLVRTLSAAANFGLMEYWP